MKLQGDYLFEAPLEEVWRALMDPIVLAAVMPGCDKLELVDGRYQGELNIKVGPVQGKFSGKVDLKDVDEPRGYTMIIDGRGAPGFVKATARVKLENEGNKTRLRYDADAQVGGKIASIGQRLLDASAKAIAKQSLDGLHENVKARAAVAKEPEEAPEAPPESGAIEDSESDPPASESDSSANEAKSTSTVAVIKTNQAAFAASVAKEVGKSLVPPTLLYALLAGIVAVIVWLILT